MTAPRIISAAVARALLEDATPGPWEIEDKPRECKVYISTEHGEPRLQYTGWSGFISVYGSQDLPHVGQIVANANAALVAAAPDLAASVVALHAEVERLTALAEDQRWDARDDVYIAGLRERRRIVAWLRTQARIFQADLFRQGLRNGLLYAAVCLDDSEVTP